MRLPRCPGTLQRAGTSSQCSLYPPARPRSAGRTRRGAEPAAARPQTPQTLTRAGKHEDTHPAAENQRFLPKPVQPLLSIFLIQHNQGKIKKKNKRELKRHRASSAVPGPERPGAAARCSENRPFFVVLVWFVFFPSIFAIKEPLLQPPPRPARRPRPPQPRAPAPAALTTSSTSRCRSAFCFPLGLSEPPAGGAAGSSSASSSSNSSGGARRMVRAGGAGCAGQGEAAAQGPVSAALRGSAGINEPFRARSPSSLPGEARNFHPVRERERPGRAIPPQPLARGPGGSRPLGPGPAELPPGDAGSPGPPSGGRDGAGTAGPPPRSAEERSSKSARICSADYHTFPMEELFCQESTQRPAEA